MSQQLEAIKMFHRAQGGTGASGKIKTFLLCLGRTDLWCLSPVRYRPMTRYLNAPCEKDMEHCCPGLVLLQSIRGSPSSHKVTATSVWIQF